MDEQGWTLRHRAAVFLGLRDEDLSEARQKRRATTVGIVLIVIGALLLAMAVLLSGSVLSGVCGAGFVIVGVGSLMQASRLG